MSNSGSSFDRYEWQKQPLIQPKEYVYIVYKDNGKDVEQQVVAVYKNELVATGSAEALNKANTEFGVSYFSLPERLY